VLGSRRRLDLVDACGGCGADLAPGRLAAERLGELEVGRKESGRARRERTIDGVAFDAFLNTNGADYVWTGSYGSQKIKVTVHFSTKDPDAFMVSGTVGSSAISMNCPPESANATSFPLTGSIGGQKLKVLWDERTAL